MHAIAMRRNIRKFKQCVCVNYLATNSIFDTPHTARKICFLLTYLLIKCIIVCLVLIITIIIIIIMISMFDLSSFL